MNNEKFIEKIGKIAHEDMKKNKICASLTIAQAILESGWGESELTVQANNLFGIKGKYNGRSFWCNTFEYINGKRVEFKAEFRSYPSWQESLRDHSTFIRNVRLNNGQLRYADVIGETDYKKACTAIQRAGYATAPEYASCLIKLIEEHRLYKFDTNFTQKYQVRVWTFSTKQEAEIAKGKINNLDYYCEVEELK